MNFIQFNGGNCVVLFLVIFVSFSMGLHFLYNAVIAAWSEQDSSLENQTIAFIIIALVMTVYVIEPASSYLLFSSGIRACSKIHKKMISSVVFSPTSFFDRNPTGRILNRFTSDMGSMDANLMIIFGHML